MESSSEESIDFSPIELLPTEILQKILSYLPFNERIRAERVCKRWKSVSTEQVWRDVQVLFIIDQRYSYTYHKFRDCTKKFGKLITMEDNKLYIGTDELEIMQSLVSRAGQRIKKVMYDCNNIRPAYPVTADILSIIAAHCHNIEHIQLNSVRHSACEVFSRILEVNIRLNSIMCLNAKSIIEILLLRNWKSLCIGRREYLPRMIALIKNSPSLEEFCVQYWTPNMLTAILKCKKLKKLHFPRPKDIAVLDLVSFTPLLHRLTCLELSGEHATDLIIDVLRHCINLEKLDLYYEETLAGHLPLAVLQAVLNLPKLEFLAFDNCLIDGEMLSRSVKFRNLRINFKSQRVGIFEMIINSTCLEELELRNISVSRKLFERLVQKAREHQQILKIKVSRSIYREVLEICEGSTIHVIEELDTSCQDHLYLNWHSLRDWTKKTVRFRGRF